MLSTGDLFSHLTYLLSLLYLGKHGNPKIVPSNAVFCRFTGVWPLAAWFLQYCWHATHIHDAVWLHKSCTVIIWVHLLAAGAIAVEEVKFCTAAAELCCTHHALCADASCCWKKKIASTACVITASITLSYLDILLITKRGWVVTK